jgi:hypothetical protein
MLSTIFGRAELSRDGVSWEEDPQLTYTRTEYSTSSGVLMLIGGRQHHGNTGRMPV